jgi:hypothetical protein
MTNDEKGCQTWQTIRSGVVSSFGYRQDENLNVDVETDENADQFRHSLLALEFFRFIDVFRRRREPSK